MTTIPRKLLKILRKKNPDVYFSWAKKNPAFAGLIALKVTLENYFFSSVSSFFMITLLR